MENHDFGGFATVANRKCSDGLTIAPSAFEHMDKQKVPLVFQHIHKELDQVLGHAILEHRPNGVYAYCYFNDTKQGQTAKSLVQHKDLDSLSIWANNLAMKSKTVVHGNIREVSLVLSGANPEARIDFVRVQHSSDPDDVSVLDDEAILVFGEKIEHANVFADQDALEHQTVQDVYDTLNEDQLTVVNYMIGQALEQGKQQVEHSDESDDNTDDKSTDNDQDASGDSDLAHQEGTMTTRTNVFEKNDQELKHSASGAGGYNGSGLTTEQISTLLHTAQQTKSLKEAILAHAEDYGVTNIEVLFPDAKMIDSKPEWITRKIEWVEGVLNGTQKLPWSRIKSRSADLTFDTARAKGYIKATMKKDQFFTISQRETTPKTIYKRQKLDRDDIIDITDFDIVAWLWVEMRFMLREEVARAIMVGDGREVDDPDKINENNIRPIAFDDEFYTDKLVVPGTPTPDQLVEAVIRGRNTYKGSAPTAYMTYGTMVDMLLEKDDIGRRLWRTKAELANELMVKDIVEVEILEGVKRDGLDLIMIIVNVADYAVGSTKGGEITTFEDFDIDWNQYKYLIETRLSGALVKHKTAQVVLRGTSTLATLTEPTFVKSTGVLTVPTVTGVTYYNVTNPLSPVAYSSGAQTAIASGATIEVEARPNTGYHFAHGADNDWEYTRD